MSNSQAESTSLATAPILHVDLDAFFASVEILDDPSLEGKPVAVGGAAERGVIASASYAARARGVYSAMPTVTARRVCPDLIVLPGNFARYEEVSSHFHRILEDLSPVYEPLSLDEAFVDLSSLRRLGVEPIAAAHELRTRIRDEVGVGSGIGVARNKLFAKLGSKSAKATFEDGKILEGVGVFVVTPDVERRWLDELPVRALWGVGPAMSTRLARLGVHLIRDLAPFTEAMLAPHVGKAMAATLMRYHVGEDDRPVIPNRKNKSIGHMETFAMSLTDELAISREIRRHSGIVARALRDTGQLAKTVSLQMKFDDLTSVSRSHTVDFALDDEDAFASIANELLATIERTKPVRLLGITLSQFSERSTVAVPLTFDFTVGEEAPHEVQLRRESLREAIDDVRRRFGRSSVGTGIELREEGLDVERQRDHHAFGPDAASNQ